MNELRQLMTEKNFSIEEVCTISGYGRRMMHYYLSGARPTPQIILDAVRLEPASTTDKITRGEFIQTLASLGITPLKASTDLVRHYKRVLKMADPQLNESERIAITRQELDKLKAKNA